MKTTTFRTYIITGTNKKGVRQCISLVLSAWVIWDQQCSRDVCLFFPPAPLLSQEKMLSKAKLCHWKPALFGLTATAHAPNSPDTLFLLSNHQFYDGVLKEIQPVLDDSRIIISLAPSYTIADLKQSLGASARIIRAMPNTPAMVGEGMTGLSWSEDVFSDTERQELMQFFTSFGKTETVPENLMDAVTAASGSSPAFIYMMIEALADGVVKYGMPRDKAYTFVAQAVLGSAKMVLETGEHPGVLKDKVCSPGGTTIAAVAALEASGFRSSLIEAVSAVCDRCRNM